MVCQLATQWAADLGLRLVSWLDSPLALHLGCGRDLGSVEMLDFHLGCPLVALLGSLLVLHLDYGKELMLVPQLGHWLGLCSAMEWDCQLAVRLAIQLDQ